MKYSIFIFLLLASTAHASDLDAVLQNNRGVKNFNDKKPVEAFDKFTSSLAEMPFSGVVHYNIGTTFLANQELDKAVSEFQEAVRTSPTDSAQDRKVRFYSYFDAGVALTAAKKTDEALEAYQHALDENPESVETKTNIELLTQNQGGGGESDKDDKDDKKKDQKQDQKQDPKKDPKGGKDPKDQKDPKVNKDNKQPPKDPKQDQKPKEKPTPRPFKSDQLSQQDVGKILDELKQQEEQIRARMQNDKVKDAPAEKDW